MGLSVRPSTKKDLDYIIERMWLRGIKEITAWGWTSCEAWGEQVAIYIHHNDAVTMEIDEKPVALLAWEWLDSNTVRTWFTAIEQISEGRLGLTSSLARTMNELASIKTSIKKIEIHSITDDYYTTSRWFKVLGFEVIGEYVYKGSKVHVFMKTINQDHLGHAPVL